jgi:FkbM family methyltransferase
MHKLIFDVGMHRGEDTSYYLAKGCNVVAIDADSGLIKEATSKFQDYLNTKRLILLNYAICDKEDQEIDFYICDNTVWSSLKSEIASRIGLSHQIVKVKAKRLSSIMNDYGIPFYCKIDVEGYDVACLETLYGLQSLPKFISVETECLGEFESLTDEEALATLNHLYRLGYTKFKLVDQCSLIVLQPGMEFYKKRGYIAKLVNRLNRTRLSLKFRHFFPSGSSGPFGDDLDSDWLDYQAAKKNFLFHRRLYFTSPGLSSFGFWCDWHAKLEG